MFALLLRRRCFRAPLFAGALPLLIVSGTRIAAAQVAPPAATAAPFTLGSSVPTLDDSEAPAPSVSDQGYQPPKVLKHPTPAYPELPHLNRIEGVVRVRFSVDETGHVAGVIVSKSSGSVVLDGAVVHDPVLKDWTFEPALSGGQPVPSAVEKEFEYRLDPAEERTLAAQRLALPVGMPQPPYPAKAEALKAQGTCTVGLYWTNRGLVDLIYLDKTSGSRLLDNTALRYVYTHWRIDPKDAPPKDKDGKQPPTLKTITFTPPGGAGAGASPAGTP